MKSLVNYLLFLFFTYHVAGAQVTKSNAIGSSDDFYKYSSLNKYFSNAYQYALSRSLYNPVFRKQEAYKITPIINQPPRVIQYLLRPNRDLPQPTGFMSGSSRPQTPFYMRINRYDWMIYRQKEKSIE